MKMKTNKRMLQIFFAIAFGMPVILGIFMGIGFQKGLDVTGFPLVWMYLPASAVMTGALLTQKKQEDSADALPRALYITFPVITAVMAALTVLNVFLPDAGLAGLTNLLIYLSCFICFIEMVCLKKEKREQFGLCLTKNWKKGLAGIGIFVLLYLFLTALSLLFAQVTGGDMSGYSLNPYINIYIMILPVNLLLSYTAFFGEEYGWRYYLQPVLQEKFGLKKGVIVLGLLWGIWHLPINLFYYSPSTSIQSILVQIAGCVGMGVFFGWVYMRTQNVWAVATIHFLNNNLGMTLFLISSAGVERQWADTIMIIVCYLVVFLPFLLTKEYREKKES